MKESFEARIENLTRSHQEAQAHVIQETHHREEMERTYPPGILEAVKQIENLKITTQSLRINIEEIKLYWEAKFNEKVEELKQEEAFSLHA